MVELATVVRIVENQEQVEKVGGTIDDRKSKA